MITRYRVAAIQFEPELGAKDRNLDRLLALCTVAAQAGARLIVTPEMATTGYCWYDRAEVAPFVEPIPGPTTERFTALARAYGCYVVVGMPEVDPATGIFYNSAALVGPRGLVGSYRKTHSFVSEPKWAKNGDRGLPVWATELGRLGILICMDADFFEPARLLTLQGADVLCFPTNWLLEKGPAAAWMARALENGRYLVAADRYGCERGVQFSGGSAVIDPDGSIQTRLDTGEGIVYGEVDLARVTPDLLAARRPAYYDTLTLDTYLWNPLEFHGLYGYRPLPPGRRSSVAVTQLDPVPGDPEQNLTRLEQALAGVPHQARLVVFPEYALTGVPRDMEDAARLALPCDERLVRALRRLARRFRTVLAVGFLERLAAGFASSVLLVAPAGVLAHYRKLHVIGSERSFLVPGDAPPPVVDLPLGRVGLLVGTDLLFPELARTLAVAGCDLILAPVGPLLPPVRGLGPTTVPLPPPAVTGDDPTHFHLGRVRAFENMTYVAYAALPQPQGTGWSALFGPVPETRAGERLLEPNAVGTVWGIVDTTNLRTPYPTNPVRAKDLLRMRRTDLYDLLQVPLERLSVMVSAHAAARGA